MSHTDPDKTSRTDEELIEAVIDNSTTPLVVLDDADHVVFANAAAGKLLESMDAVAGNTLSSSCPAGRIMVLQVSDHHDQIFMSPTIEWDGARARLVSTTCESGGPPGVVMSVQPSRGVEVNRLGMMALQGAAPQELYAAVAEIVCDIFGVEFSTVLEYHSVDATATLVAGVGWPEGFVGRYSMPVDRSSQASMAILTGQPVVVTDWRQEQRFPGVRALHDNGVISGINVVIPGEDGSMAEPWGVLGAHATSRRTFGTHDVGFMQSLANVLAQAMKFARTLALKDDSDVLLRAATRTARLGGWELDPQADQVVWSEATSVIHGLPREQAVLTQAQVEAYAAPEYRQRANESMGECLKSGTHFDIKLKIVTERSEERWIRATGEPVYDENGNIVRARGAVQDITEKKRNEEEINFLALYDALTQLPNRRLFEDRLRQALATSRRSGGIGALMLIDLDNFKSLNDTRGHYVGDRLLQKVAQRLRESVRQSDTVARFGGDEFVLIINNLGDTPDDAAVEAESVGRKLLAQLKHAYQLGSQERFSTQSIGVTLFGGTAGSQVSELLKQADLAMYQAKARGRDQLCLFDPAMQATVSARAELETEMRHGLRHDEFYACYQPQVDAGGRVTGAEMLVRWKHPQRGIVSPGEFISLAEETKLILPLGQLMLETACEQLVRWAGRDDAAHLTLSVNVSAEQFHHPDFVSRVLGVVEKTGVDPSRLVLELTESSVVKDIDETARKMAVLENHGVTFSLDDFGTGYSSLYYLKHLPLAELKIDQSFVRSIHKDPGNAAIARTITGLAESLELRTIAEGVESVEERDLLTGLGCDSYQGFLFARPQPIDQFERYLADSRVEAMPSAGH